MLRAARGDPSQGRRKGLVLLTASPGRGARKALSVGAAVWILAATETVSWGLLYYTFSVLLRPMAEAVRASEVAVSGAFSIALLAAGAAAPLVGRAVDRHGPGAVMSVGSLVGALGFLALPAATSLPQLVAAWALLGVAHGCTSYEPAFAAVTSWIDDLRARRRALLVITSFGGLASTLFVPLATAAIATLGFELTAVAFAVVLALLVTPLHLALTTVRAPAREAPSPSVQAPAARAGLSLLAAVLATQALASTAVATFLFPTLTDRGIAAPQAAALVGIVGAAQVPARLFYGVLCARVPSKARLALLLVVQGLAVSGFGTLSGAPLAGVLVLFGAANGLMTLERATIVAEWFGVRGYGARSGLLAAGSAVARASAPVVVALSAEVTSYARAFLPLAVALAAAAALQAVLELWRGVAAHARPPRPRR